VSKTDINVGDSDTLTWSCTNTSSCNSTGGFSTGGKTSGHASVTPATTGLITYGITCSGAPFYFPQIDVHSPDVSISASPTRVLVGGNTTVSWTSTHTLSCSITKNGSAWKSGLSNAGVTTPIQTQTTFTITCSTSGAPVTDSVVVDVQADFQEF
jgi:hypothetical protein